MADILRQIDGRSFIYGMELIETHSVTKSVPIRPHRKRRINKKWMKRYGTKEVPDYQNIVIANGCVFAQPKTIKKIIESVKNYE